jgi:pyruvate/2-oxoacid:ferredoxin oxidoreductase beta subunit/flavodoxin
MLRTQSHWLVGGDGWAYDIGYGGLDHVISRGENVNILVLDTEMYSNTGGQVSKATQLSTVTKFATGGKRQVKKDLGLCAMQYENVYVASVALGANMNQCVQAFKEAEQYPGTSLLICYSPCIDWGIEMKHMMDQQKTAVESGYWTLYRYDPRRIDQGVNPFQLDSKKIKSDLLAYLDGENRFTRLKRSDAETADSLHNTLNSDVHRRHTKYQRLAMDDYELLESLKMKLGEEVDTEKVVVLYGSETGTAEYLSGVFASELKRRGIRAKCLAMDDFDFDDLPKQSKVFAVVATCGQGEFPANCKEFWKQLSDPSLPKDLLKDTKIAMFGLGDSSYVFFNEAAKQFNNRFQELGASTVMEIGMGDDKDEDRWETRWNEWIPELWNELGTPPPPQELLPPSYRVLVEGATSAAVPDVIVPTGTKQIPMVKNQLLTPVEYDRDIRHYEFDLKGSGMSYSVGDCLGIYPHNARELVDNFCSEYGLSPESILSVEDTQGRKDPLPGTLTARQLFTEVLDMFGKPSRRFYETLGIAATDDSERKEIEHLLSKEGKDDLRALVKETVTYADLFNRYPSSKLNLEYILDFVPRIKPRLYSIASSIDMHPDMVHLCIVKDD